jgi:hypothetical protein
MHKLCLDRVFFYERHDASRTVSTAALFVAAAVICLLPVG